REAGKRFLAGGRAEANRGAAALRREPDGAGVDERDLVGRHGRLAEHARVDLRRRGNGCGGSGEERENDLSSHEAVPFEARAVLYFNSSSCSSFFFVPS